MGDVRVLWMAIESWTWSPSGFPDVGIAAKILAMLRLPTTGSMGFDAPWKRSVWEGVASVYFRARRHRPQ